MVHEGGKVVDRHGGARTFDSRRPASETIVRWAAAQRVQNLIRSQKKKDRVARFISGIRSEKPPIMWQT
jgi:hypothetical protein